MTSPASAATQRLLPEERRRLILERLKQFGSVTVEDLAREFNVSAVTARSDLDGLSHAGLLVRSHGGAVRAPSMHRELHLTVKETLHQSEKSRIASAAAKLVQNDETIILDSGTTTLGVARKLRTRGLDNLTVITNALNIAMELAALQQIRLLMLGGILRHVSQSLVGPPAEKALRELNADRAFIGVDGLDLEAGLSTPDLLEAQLTRLVMEAAREVVIVADSSKFGRRALSIISPLTPGLVVVTDDGISQATRRSLEEREIELIVV